MDAAASPVLPTDPWMGAMRRGDFAAAWEINDATLRTRGVRSTPDVPRHLQTIWNGESPAGRRVLVRCYHGLGDTIQFIRYLPMLRAAAREVILWVQPALVELLRGFPGVDRLLPLHDGTPAADYDLDVEIMELPHVFRTVLGNGPYLRVEAAPRLPIDRLNVGLVWRAGEWDPRRSVPLSMLAAALPGARLHALQRGPGLAEWTPQLGPDLGSDRAEQTAAAMQALDLIISVDSFPAHLAGALGRPTWLLLPTEADWRWMEGRDRSPWYPTMRLFRQEIAGDWRPVMSRLTSALAKLVAAHNG